MLEEKGAEFTFRDTRKDPLTENEVEEILALLDVPARDLLRRRDRAFKGEGLTGDEEDRQLVPLFARHPGLMQRPLALRGDRALVARPPEEVLRLLGT